MSCGATRHRIALRTPTHSPNIRAVFQKRHNHNYTHQKEPLSPNLAMRGAYINSGSTDIGEDLVGRPNSSACQPCLLWGAPSQGQTRRGRSSTDGASTSLVTPSARSQRQRLLHSSGCSRKRKTQQWRRRQERCPSRLMLGVGRPPRRGRRGGGRALRALGTLPTPAAQPRGAACRGLRSAPPSSTPHGWTRHRGRS